MWRLISLPELPRRKVLTPSLAQQYCNNIIKKINNKLGEDESILRVVQLPDALLYDKMFIEYPKDKDDLMVLILRELMIRSHIVQEKDIQAIQNAMTVPKKKQFAPHDKVNITGGLYQGSWGHIVELGEDSCTIEIELFGQAQLIQESLENIRLHGEE